MKFFEILNNPGNVPVTELRVVVYDVFREQTVELLSRKSCHCLDYFTVETGENVSFFILVANDDSHKIMVYSHHQVKDVKSLESITKNAFQMHVFERIISEKTGVIFEKHPWLKPLRYPHDRKDKQIAIADYPFYHIDSEETHEVGVGPIHAGIIEPGHFRFGCYGEKVLHLEIQLGYQHRGIENMFRGKADLLKLSVLSENIAGDTASGHGLAFSQLVETLAGKGADSKTVVERTIALEMERMAVHAGDTAALCGDIAYQPGQVACEAIRTVIINTLQDWCGNRFSRGMMRPVGTNYPITSELLSLIGNRMDEVHRRFAEVTDLIYSNPGVLVRFENTGPVTQKQALLSGAVGMAARTCGIARDIRASHPFQAYRQMQYKPVMFDSGDVYARGMIRRVEFNSSYKIITSLLDSLSSLYEIKQAKPDYSITFQPSMMAVSLVEGWRGEICHTAVTGENSDILTYKIKDPSLHNWHVLALAVRDQEISDFPVCNKSFNLSYCGNDL